MRILDCNGNVIQVGWQTGLQNDIVNLGMELGLVEKRLPKLEGK